MLIRRIDYRMPYEGKPYFILGDEVESDPIDGKGYTLLSRGILYNWGCFTPHDRKFKTYMDKEAVDILRATLIERLTDELVKVAKAKPEGAIK